MSVKNYNTMKKSLLFILLSFSAFSVTFLTAQIPNPSFENWSTVNDILKPDGWSIVGGTGIPTTISPSHPGADSPTAAKMTVMTFAGKPWCSILQTFCKFTTRSEAVTFYVKSNNPSNDTLIASVAVFNKNIVIGHGELNIKGNIPEFTLVGVKIEYNDTITKPDSASIYFGFEDQKLHLNTEFYIDALLQREYWGGVNDLVKCPYSIGGIVRKKKSKVFGNTHYSYKACLCS